MFACVGCDNVNKRFALPNWSLELIINKYKRSWLFGQCCDFKSLFTCFREELVALSWSVCLRVFTEQLFFGLCSKTDKYAHSKGWWWLTAAGLSSLLIPLVKPMDFEIELNWQTLSVLKMSPSLHISLSVKNKTKQTNRDINCSFSHY